MTDNLFNTGVRPSIDAYLKKKGEEVRDYGDYWSASSAGYCMRLNILRRLGCPKVPELEDNATQTRIFESGHIFHEWVQRITKDAGLSIASEIELQDEELMIRGHIDDLVLITGPEMVAETYGKAVHDRTGSTVTRTPEGDFTFRDKADDRLILYDYKTAHSASFNYKKNQPMGHYHTMQLATYMYMLNAKKQELLNFVVQQKADAYRYGLAVPVGEIDPAWKQPVGEGRILSISKDDLRMHETQLLWDNKLEDKIQAYWSVLNRYWDERKMPPCTCLEHDGGFMGRRSSKGKVYNDFFWEDEPCSLVWYAKMKAEGRLK